MVMAATVTIITRAIMAGTITDIDIIPLTATPPIMAMRRAIIATGHIIIRVTDATATSADIIVATAIITVTIIAAIVIRDRDLSLVTQKETAGSGI